METVSKEQFKIIRKSKMQEILDYLFSLNVGDVALIKFEDFEKTGIRSPFVGYFHQYLRQVKHPMKFSTALNERAGGWYIIRTC